MERLQKVIASAGIASRRKAEEIIKEGRVLVNEEIVLEMGVVIGKGDKVEVDGIQITREDKVYYVLYKPRNTITTNNDEKGRKTVTQLINTNKRIFPIGRLDYDTTGVLLLTNDGEFSNKIMHPKYEMEKVYIAKIKGVLNTGDLIKFKKGFMVEGYKTKSAKVKVKKVNLEKGESIVELAIHEGKNHQVKNMFKTLGYNVIKLKRERIAFITTDGLKPGEYRELSTKEVHVLYNLASNKSNLIF
ncbi:MAG: pseudouridine synthase [Bacilli bacterium]